MESTWLSLWTTFLSKFEEKFNLKLIAVSLQQVLPLFHCTLSVSRFAAMHLRFAYYWLNLRAGNTRSRFELGSITSILGDPGAASLFEGQKSSYALQINYQPLGLRGWITSRSV